MSRLSQFALISATLAGLCTSIAGHAQATKSAADYRDSRVDIYAGYAYFQPVGSDIHGYEYQPIYNPNATMSVSGYFTRYLGAQVEGGYFSGNAQHAGYDAANGVKCNDASCDQILYTVEAGPVFRLPLGKFVPFVHALGGGAKVNGPVNQPLTWGWAITGGAGMDYILPFLNQHFAWRMLQADYHYSFVNYGPLQLPLGLNGGDGILQGIKLSTGLDLRLGGEVTAKRAVQLGCSLTPFTVFPGDPIAVNSSTTGTDPKAKPVYTWTSNGGKVTGAGESPTIDTKGMIAGQYEVHGHLSEGSKPTQQADCEAPFTVRAYDPPTIACTATPSSALSGTVISISTSGGSPQNRPLTYSYSSTQGVITSSGPTATLLTAGLSPGPITITCNVVDDLGKSAKTTTSVQLSTPPPPVLPSTSSLCKLSFDHDKRRPVRVDNQASACLDDVAIALTQQSDAKLVIVGDFEAPETVTAAEERAINARLYLTQQKGIDPSRIELRAGDGAGKAATDTLVPAGAIFNEVGTHRFNEAAVTQHGQPYGLGAAAAKKKAPKHGPGAPPVVTPGKAPVSNTPTR